MIGCVRRCWCRDCLHGQVLWALVLLPVYCLGGPAPEPPCGDPYGSTAGRVAIQGAMLSGDRDRVQHAIDTAKRARGQRVGCPEIAYAQARSRPNVRPPDAADIGAVWYAQYQTRLPDLAPGCPLPGRALAPIALAAWQAGAQHAPSPEETASLIRIADFYRDQQYTPEHAPEPLVADAGVYGYYFSEGDYRCELTGVAGEITEQMCAGFPNSCPRYDGGRFAGLRFAVRDHVWIDADGAVAVRGDIGGSAFDTGWVGSMMIEAAVRVDDTVRALAYAESALLAGDWAASQPLSANHNYTAKTIWLLAQLYEWTGRAEFREAMVDRLERNLVPGVLMDQDGDGVVDGTDGMRFADLAAVARRPGRMWDGHNALPWYHSMNAWAMVAAYTALRDRGNRRLAARYRPYAVAMIDNLAAEFVELGIPVGQRVAWSDIPFSLLMAIHRIAQYEDDPHPLWDQAVAAIWNAGVLDAEPGSHGFNLTFYEQVLLRVPYRSLVERADIGRRDRTRRGSLVPAPP